MSVGTARVVTDHELYRIFSFSTWESRESSEVTAHRLRRLGRELKNLGWMPQDLTLPDRSQTAGWKERLWGDDPSHTRERDEGWLERTVGISYPEELLVYVGLLRREDRGEDDWQAWISSTTQRWDARHPRATHWETAFAPPDRAEHDDRPRILGEGWVWTGEWDGPPGPDGWGGFGNRVYGPGRHAVYPWGLLGFPDDPKKLADGLPRFDLHATTDPASKKARDEFLYWEFPRLLTCFLKANQFLRQRLRTSRALLEDQERRLQKLSEPPRRTEIDALGTTTQRARETINALTDHLYVFAALLTSMETDARSLDLAREEVRRFFPDPTVAGAPRPWLVDALELSARQLAADLDYARMTMAVSDRLLQKHAIFGEIEETRATERLTKLGMVLGAVLGGMQLTPETAWRGVMFAIGVGSCGLLYREEIKARVWGRWGRRTS